MNGFRFYGRRKVKLIKQIQKELEAAGKRGVNVAGACDYVGLRYEKDFKASCSSSC